MANPLTGDFEAVLQISGSTINRLLASMHQNASAKPNLPSFPHSASFRIGDDGALDGVRGSVRVQVSVPRIELIHGATDRFKLEVGIRARYKPDSGSEPLPEFIHGTVHAEYRVQDIDPSCLGWSDPSNYLWLRVVKESVRFDGTAFDDWDPLAVVPSLVDEHEVEARITRLIATLLATRFEAAPHPVSKRFRRGSLRSLSVPIGGSAVAIPVGLTAEPMGHIHSINNLLLEGSDFGVGVRVEHLLAMIEPTIAAIRAYTQNFRTVVSPFIGPDIVIHHTARVTAAGVQWEPHGSHALLKISVDGRVETDSVFTDLSFSVNQVLMVTFDPDAEVLRLAHVSRSVNVKADGLGATQRLTDSVAAAVGTAVKAHVDAATANVQPSFANAKTELTAQLRTFDDQANARFDEGIFLPGGLILRGTVSLAPRQKPVVRFDETLEEDGYSAFLSWIPGGRIEQLAWSWRWFGSGQPGVATHDDRFLLRRPRATRSRWGGLDLSGNTTPLPGLDGMGVVCLQVKGARVDPVTGALIPVESASQCTRFGFSLKVTPHEGFGGLFWRLWPEEPELSKDVPFPELALFEVGGTPTAALPAANSLVLYVDERWQRETASTLTEALDVSRRTDAGLMVVVLFREGLLGSDGQARAAEVEELADRLGAPVLVNEDVGGSWAAALALPVGTGDQAWRLISPRGGVTWAHDGRVDAEMLAAALDHYLIPSGPPKPEPIRANLEVGTRVSVAALHPGFVGQLEAKCPPLPLGRLGLGGAVVTFVRRGAESSHAQLRELNARYGRGGEERPVVVAVIGGADVREAEALKRELGLDFATLPDPSGTLGRRFGVRLWPTTVTLNHSGIVSAIEMGFTVGPPEAPEGKSSANQSCS